MVVRQRLGVEHVERRAGQAGRCAALRSARLPVTTGPRATLIRHAPGTHRGQFRRADQAARLLGQRARQHDEIASREQRRPARTCCAAGASGRRPRARVRQHPHRQSPAAQMRATACPTWPKPTSPTVRPRQLEPAVGERPRRRPAGAAPACSRASMAPLRRASCSMLQQHVLGHGVRVDARHVGDEHAVRRGRLDRDHVHAGAVAHRADEARCRIEDVVGQRRAHHHDARSPTRSRRKVSGDGVGAQRRTSPSSASCACACGWMACVSRMRGMLWVGLGQAARLGRGLPVTLPLGLPRGVLRAGSAARRATAAGGAPFVEDPCPSAKNMRK